MFKAMMLFPVFEAIDEFDAYYFANHVPLARKLPGLVKIEVTTFGPGIEGEDPTYHMMTEIYFRDEQAWRDAMATPVGQELTADAGNFPAGTIFGGLFLGQVSFEGAEESSDSAS